MRRSGVCEQTSPLSQFTEQSPFLFKQKAQAVLFTEIGLFTVPKEQDREYLKSIGFIDRQQQLSICSHEVVQLASENALEILDELSKPISYQQAFDALCSVDGDFLGVHQAFLALRKQGWIVKDGTKFACDLVAYPGSPLLFHSSFCVFVKRNEIEWKELQLRNRVAAQVRKTLLLYEPQSQKFIRVARWIPEENRNQ